MFANTSQLWLWYVIITLPSRSVTCTYLVEGRISQNHGVNNGCHKTYLRGIEYEANLSYGHWISRFRHMHTSLLMLTNCEQAIYMGLKWFKLGRPYFRLYRNCIIMFTCRLKKILPSQLLLKIYKCNLRSTRDYIFGVVLQKLTLITYSEFRIC